MSAGRRQEPDARSASSAERKQRGEARTPFAAGIGLVLGTHLSCERHLRCEPLLMRLLLALFALGRLLWRLAITYGVAGVRVRAVRLARDVQIHRPVQSALDARPRRNRVLGPAALGGRMKGLLLAQPFLLWASRRCCCRLRCGRFGWGRLGCGWLGWGRLGCGWLGWGRLACELGCSRGRECSGRSGGVQAMSGPRVG